MIDATKSKVYGFKAIPKDLTSVAQKLIQNDNLCKLLFYTTKDVYKKDISKLSGKFKHSSKLLRALCTIFLKKIRENCEQKNQKGRFTF